MPLDPDARQMVDLLESIAPVPNAHTVAYEYREGRAADLAERQVEVIPVDQVETFDVEGRGGPVTVRCYRHGSEQGNRPTLLYMHGGGFVTCSIETHDPYCRTLARETGLTIVSIDYRLAPEHPYPAGFEDCLDVLNWAVSDEARRHGIDRSRIIVSGDSAGGALAAALAIWARDNGGPPIIHQLLIYPVTLNDFSTASYAENAEGFYLTQEAMRWFWKQYIGEEEGEVDQFSAPGSASDLSGLPPATIITAGYDPLRDDGAKFAARLEEANVPVVYRDFAGAFHGFAGMFTLDCAQQSLKFIVEQLKAAVAGTT